jgi:hypothetical protein
MTEATAPAATPAPDPSAGMTEQQVRAAFSAGTTPTTREAATLTADASHMVARGLLTREAANRDLQAMGLPPLDAAAPVASGEQAAAVDAAPIEPAAKPTDYKMPALSEPGRQPTKEAMAGDVLMRNALSTAGFARDVGSSLLAEAARTHTTFSKLSPDQQAGYAAAERTKLTRLWGDAATPGKLALADRLLNEVEQKHPGTIDLMRRSGALSNAMTVSLIVSRAEQLAVRRR